MLFLHLSNNCSVGLFLYLLHILLFFLSALNVLLFIQSGFLRSVVDIFGIYSALLLNRLIIISSANQVMFLSWFVCSFVNWFILLNCQWFLCTFIKPVSPIPAVAVWCFLPSINRPTKSFYCVYNHVDCLNILMQLLLASVQLQ